MKIREYVPCKNYALLIAILISLLLHLAWITGIRVHTSANIARTSPIEVSLSTVNSSVTNSHEDIVNNTQPTNIKSNLINSDTKMVAQENSGYKNTDQISSLKQDNSNELPNSSLTHLKADSQIPSSSLPSQTLMPPTSAEMEFELYSENDNKLIGYGLHQFTTEDSDHYQINIQKIPNTLSDENWSINIKGRVFRNILSPSVYVRQGSVAASLMAIGEVSGHFPPSQGRLPDNIMDKQSLLYQFMLSPPSIQGGAVLLSDGRSIHSYHYQPPELTFIDNQNLGKLRASKVTLIADDTDEIIEIWLSPDFNYLPLKLRHKDNNNIVTIQTTLSISIKN
ncbi:hypothetical protein A7981_01165 [Methylovorus sp. MM2]|uniref:DUF3108 domain-containing protein n=1 Tax=Methylovorus sp. MM2 TaxID=1848038 RepID=UPI0007DF88C4|nr:DUF3108 domain-containing protein [Methylovorus sp. MM2]OAM52129.1 hypothetical protein A7981_01165 [Methylovorus sp. MM2]